MDSLRTLFDRAILLIKGLVVVPRAGRTMQAASPKYEGFEVGDLRRLEAEEA